MIVQKISLNALPMYITPFVKGILVRTHTFQLQAPYKTALAFTSYLHRALKHATADILLSLSFLAMYTALHIV